VLGEALAQHQENVGCRPRTVVADKGYGTADVYRSMAERGITPYIPHANHQSARNPGLYEARRFQYAAERDAYLCPQGQWLKRHGTSGRGYGHYRAAKSVCAACVCCGQCTTARDGRALTRSLGQEWIEWADGCFSREHRRRLRRRRMYRAEGSFADAANHHGYKRARWRGLVGLTMQNLLVAAAQNLRKLLRASWRKPATALLSVGLAARFDVAAVRRLNGNRFGCLGRFTFGPTRFGDALSPSCG
jgi:hypothetical protein